MPFSKQLATYMYSDVNLHVLLVNPIYFATACESSSSTIITIKLRDIAKCYIARPFNGSGTYQLEIISTGFYSQYLVHYKVWLLNFKQLVDLMMIYISYKV